MLLRINNPRLTNLEETFIHRNAWFGICNFAFTSKDDQWAAPLHQTSKCKPEDVFSGALIYATPWGIEKFLEEVHPKIKNPYCLVTFCYGPVFKVENWVKDPKIIAWFGQANSNAITFDKFTLMPLGVLADDTLFNKRVEVNQCLKHLSKKPKDKLLYMNFKVHQGQHVERSERSLIYDMFVDKLFCHTVTLTDTWRKPFMEYMDDMSQCKFSISPEGDMHDCYRHWEAMLVGSIPIVHTSPLDRIFEDLPVVIVEDYREVTEDFLNKKYEEMKGKQFNLKKLYMQYWVDKINLAEI